MTHSNEIDKISAALVSIGGEISNPHNSAVNPFHKNKYAPLNDMLNYLRPMLRKHGLAVTQHVTGQDNAIGVETVVLHESGQYMTSTVTIPIASEKGKSVAQVAGSTVSYLRRYAIAAALNVASEDDDDGNAGLTQAPQTQRSAPQRQTIPQDMVSAFSDILEAMVSKDDEDRYREIGARAYKAGDVEAFRANSENARRPLEKEMYTDEL